MKQFFQVSLEKENHIKLHFVAAVNIMASPDKVTLWDNVSSEREKKHKQKQESTGMHYCVKAGLDRHIVWQGPSISIK